MSEPAIEIDRYGGPQELRLRAVDRRPPRDDEVRIRMRFAAVNRAASWPVGRCSPAD
jgi:NADPH:quinone reductase-like Zn-dependent oxidoreductase